MSEKHAGATYIENLESSYRRNAEDAKPPKMHARFTKWADMCQLSPLGREVAEILGQVFLGIYHIEDEIGQGKVDWSHKYGIEIGTWRTLSTYDFANLTWLVVLCHDRAIRLEIGSRGYRRLKLIFHQRTRGGG